MSDGAPGSLFVVGLGLIGGSVAAAARAAGCGRIVGFDGDGAAASHARRSGLVDAITDAPATAAAECELTVLAVPVAKVADCVAAVAPAARAGFAVTDVGSVKGSVLADCRRRLGAVPRWFVAGHPLAGSERSGATAARADLFAGRVVVLTPEADTDAAALARVRALWQWVGATVVELPAAEHDRALALTSHLPHLVAYALMDLFAADPALLRLAAGGLRDATRTAASDPALWRGIFAANAGEVCVAIDALQQRLAAARSALATGDLDTVQAMCEAAHRLRVDWQRSTGGASVATATATAAAGTAPAGDLARTAPVLAIDGPSGAGKGTVASLLAARLGWHLLDSGAVYRALALVALRERIALDDEGALAARARRLDLRFAQHADGVRVHVHGRDESDAIRDEAVSAATSRVSALPAVRAALLAVQRAARQPPGLVADGRDMGTVVFTDAALKVFLTASVEERARRRHKQLMEKGLPANLVDLAGGIRERDERDANRAVAPLRPAAGALVIDCTTLPAEDVVAQVLAVLPASPAVAAGAGAAVDRGASMPD
jgi:cytidylate kinase